MLRALQGSVAMWTIGEHPRPPPHHSKSSVPPKAIIACAEARHVFESELELEARGFSQAWNQTTQALVIEVSLEKAEFRALLKRPTFLNLRGLRLLAGVRTAHLSAHILAQNACLIVLLSLVLLSFSGGHPKSKALLNWHSSDGVYSSQAHNTRTQAGATTLNGRHTNRSHVVFRELRQRTALIHSYHILLAASSFQHELLG